jgi:putative endonuclease
MSNWYVYIVRCSDNSLYTGITREVGRRLEEHNSNNRLAARYTRARRPVTLVYQEACRTHSAAARREHAIKRLGRKQKEALISGLRAC